MEFKWNKTPARITKDVGIDATFALFAATTAERMMDKYVPFKQGTLSQNTSFIQKGLSVGIKYNVPYAHYQYNGVGFDRTTEFHPLATYEWDKAFWRNDKTNYLATINAYRILRAK